MDFNQENQVSFFCLTMDLIELTVIKMATLLNEECCKWVGSVSHLTGSASSR